MRFASHFNFFSTLDARNPRNFIGILICAKLYCIFLFARLAALEEYFEIALNALSAELYCSRSKKKILLLERRKIFKNNLTAEELR